MRTHMQNRVTAGIVASLIIVAVPEIAHNSQSATAAHRPVPAPVTALAFPSQISIPAELAQAIGQARANTAVTCPQRQAVGWVELDEGGVVQGIHASCAGRP